MSLSISSSNNSHLNNPQDLLLTTFPKLEQEIGSQTNTIDERGGLCLDHLNLQMNDPIAIRLTSENLLFGGPTNDITSLKELVRILLLTHKEIIHFPLIIAYGKVISNLLRTIAEKRTSFCSKIIKIENPSFIEVITYFLIEIDAFKRTKNSQKIIDFLTTCFDVFKEEEIIGNQIVHDAIGSVFLVGIELFISFQQFLDMPLLHIVESPRALTLIERYYHAIGGYEILTSSLHFLSFFNRESNDDYCSKRVVVTENVMIIKTLTHFLLRETPFSYSQKIDIASVGHRLLKDFNSEEAHFYSNKNFLFFEEAYDLTNPLLNTSRPSFVEAIEQNQFLGSEYIEKQQSHFTSFIPRLKELESVLVPQAKALAEKATILKDFYLYLSLGNHERCKQALEAAPSQFKKILFNEIHLFSEELKTDRQLALKGIKSINEGLESLKTQKIHMRRYFSQQENYYTHFVKLCHTLLTSPLSYIEKSFSDLFIYRVPTTSQEPARAKKFPKRKGETSNQTTDVQSKNLKMIETSAQLTKAQDYEVSPPKIIDPLLLLKEIQEHEKSVWEKLAPSCSGFQAKEALVNSKTHLDGILSLFHLFIHQAKTPLSKNQFIMFVTECVRHSSLASEQLLSALDRETNEVKDAGELKNHLDHSLFSILIQCKAQPPIPHSVREWIRDNDRGEYLVRNLNQCKLGNTSLESLLSKVQLFSMGNETFSPEGIFADLSKYLQGVINLHISILPQIGPARKENLQQLNRAFRSLCKIISVLPLNVSHSNPSSAVFHEIESMKMAIESFQCQTSSITIKNSLFNVIDYHLASLEVEMSSQQSLNPLSSYNHCTHVFLLNQMVAEEVMLCLIDHQMIDAVFEDEKQHDLFAMVEAFGMKREDFIQEEYHFLSRGKQTRMLVRYKASYDRIPKKERLPVMANIEKTLRLAKQISIKQPYEHFYKPSDGFQNNYTSNLERVKQDVSSDVSILNSVLTKCLSKVFSTK